MSSLPPPSFKPVSSFASSRLIDASIDVVWEILLDLESYPQWNPYLRSAVMVDELTRQPTAEAHTFSAPGWVQLSMQHPPSLDPKKKPTVALEQVTVVDHDTHRIVWSGGRLPVLFRAEHAHALAVADNGMTCYETRAIFGGLTGSGIKRFMGSTIEQCNEAMADALKKRAEAKVAHR